ncbi:hypothetical protein [Chitinophaga ginsengisoli]|uniref:Uncharacterized protein n=1 Tax=Chitinophaga ginsengisoli TaxID=363837 RepID=A0A2P8GAN9_9BACT|nr:hypothetical protein [Chitinophaga ginsengisoli]PSL31008.1 hypothetical protein CLV42_105371 [Chitinophaga ginsengisoli]
MNTAAYNIASEDFFSGIYSREVLAKVACGEELAKYDYYESVFQHALNLAKGKKIEESVREFEKGEERLSAEKKGSDLNAVLSDCLYPKKAYLYYKLKRMSLARLLTYKSIITNEGLKISRGFNFLVFVQTQQYHNLARIFFAESNVKEGIRLSYRLIWFLLTKESAGVKYLDKIALPVEEEESQLRCAMTYQVLFELLGVLARMKNNVALYLKSLIIFLEELIQHFNVCNEREHTLRNFLIVFSGIDLHDRSRYINAANHFLQTSKDMFPNTERVIKLFY